MLAYLVIREGGKWTDVFRLIPDQTVTIGRAPTNQVVIKDDRCSRNHAEVFLTEGQWILRDLDSRNGTAVNDQPVKGDYTLSAGDVVRIGKSQMAFVHELSQAFADSGVFDRPPANAPAPNHGHSTTEIPVDQQLHEPTTITHRRGRTKYLDSQPEEVEAGGARTGAAATQLCRLAYSLAKAPDEPGMSKIALEGLFSGTHVDAGAVWVLPRDQKGEASADALEQVGSRSDTQQPYYRVSPFLASTVLREGEAVLARNVMGDSALSSRDSKGEIHATSVICAPIRRNKKTSGLIHLYSTDTNRVLDPDDLEFTLAVADTMAVALQNLSRRQELAENLDTVRGEIEQLRERLGVQSEIVGCSGVVARITEEIARAAPSKATILIRGESGVGKELVARAIHFSSPRRKGVFICLNCAALSESLLESELFGHEKGAFTGATERKVGKFESADGGTIMLDEIGEMSPQIQAKFLRVLEGHSFERVGGSEQIKADVRVIAATNRDLEREVAENRFRRDLYFRLKVVEIMVPALRKRPEDISDLAHYFLKKFNAETGKKIQGFTQRAMDQMHRYRWPGNVRELKNVIERATVLCQNDRIDLDDLVLSKLPTAGDTGDSNVPAGGGAFIPTSLAEIERRHILSTLEALGWNKSQAATVLGIERSTLDRKLRRYEIGEPPRKGR